MSEIKVIEGVINKVWQDEPDKYAFSIGEARMRIIGKGVCPVQEGDNEVISYKDTPKGKIFHVRKSESLMAHTEAPLQRAHGGDTSQLHTHVDETVHGGIPQQQAVSLINCAMIQATTLCDARSKNVAENGILLQKDYESWNKWFRFCLENGIDAYERMQGKA